MLQRFIEVLRVATVEIIRFCGLGYAQVSNILLVLNLDVDSQPDILYWYCGSLCAIWTLWSGCLDVLKRVNVSQGN
jgi:hypothetical protein